MLIAMFIVRVVYHNVHRSSSSKKKVVSESAPDSSKHHALPQPRLIPIPKPAPRPEITTSKPSLPTSAPQPVSKQQLIAQPPPKPQIAQPKPQLTVSPKPQLTVSPKPQPNPPSSLPVKIPTELTKPRPKPSVVIEQRRPAVAEAHPPRIDVAQLPKDIPGMSHLDAILARNGLGHYISNDFKKHGKEHPLSGGEQQVGPVRPESVEITPNTRVESGENMPSRPSSATSSISHRSILQQQHKQMSNINSVCNIN